MLKSQAASDGGTYSFFNVADGSAVASGSGFESEVFDPEVKREFSGDDSGSAVDIGSGVDSGCASEFGSETDWQLKVYMGSPNRESGLRVHSFLSTFKNHSSSIRLSG